MSATVYGENPDTSEGSSVDPIVAQPSGEEAPSQGTVIGNNARALHGARHVVLIKNITSLKGMGCYVAGLLYFYKASAKMIIL